MRQGLRTLLRTGRRWLNEECLDALDRRSAVDGSHHCPIFVLGAPRSGSTLLTQLVTQYLDVGYFSNLHAHLYGSPQIAEYLARYLPETSMSFESNFGVTRGLRAPSENPDFWYRFFRRTPPFVSLEEMPADEGRAFSASMRRFVTATNKPAIIKNLYAVLRLEVIEHFLPEARYIVIHRDLRDNAASLLNSRESHFGCYDRWWSVETPNMASLLDHDPVEQVLGQIRSVYELIGTAQQSHRFDKAAFLHVNYEEMCKDPEQILTKVRDFVPGCRAKPQLIGHLPTAFEIRRTVVKDPKLNGILLHRTSRD